MNFWIPPHVHNLIIEMDDNYPIFECEEIYRTVSNCKVLLADEVNKNDFNENEFSIFHLNIRSLRKNFVSLQALLHRLSVTFSIIVLTEIWLSEFYDVDFNLDGYRSFSLYRDKNGGGIKMYVRNCIDCMIIDQMTFVGNFF